MVLPRWTRLISAAVLLALVAIAGAIRQAESAEPRAARSAPVDAGDVAPDFTLLDQDGRARTLSKERATKDAVVLIFYRGHW
ncbi:MAG: hypothetical protein LJE97_09955 [Betaproteobacteria bacterium]|jgi:cytochrome oxidase Cu insertion factor (SCO1/SenC/PrrC family)|nr:hypothetical protein [Betaproteobacteria bacterium]